MNELFLELISQSALQLFFLLLVGYFLIVGGLYFFLRPAFVGQLDPLNIKLVSTEGIAIAGFVASPLLFHSLSDSYSIIVAFLVVWAVIIRVVGKPAHIDLRDRLDPDLQKVLLFLSIAVNVVNVTLNMILPGKIPLFMENGSAVRFEATEGSRLLTWLSLGIAPVAGILYAVTEHARVRRFAMFAIAVQLLQTLLFASKSGILAVVFILLNAVFIARARGETDRYRTLKRALKRTAILVCLAVPFYLSAIGIGANGSATGALAMRVLGGLDQLILTSQFDLLLKGHQAWHTGLFEYQLLPFFKVASGRGYEYSSVGQYVIEAATGIFIEGPYTLPNSNLILETILTSGMYLGLPLYCLELTLFYGLRRRALRSPINPLTFVLVVATVFDPIGLFASGQEWVTETVLLSVTVGFAWVVTLVWKSLRLVTNFYAEHPSAL